MEMKVCCLFFNPKTGTVILGCFGIIFFVLYLVPHALILKNHEFHVNQFVKEQRSDGDIKDEDIPDFSTFSKAFSVFCVAFGCLYICASTLLIAGVSSSKKFLLIPWLIVTYLTLLASVIFVIAFMIAMSNVYAIVVFIVCSVPVLLGVYFWMSVYATFNQMKVATPPDSNTQRLLTLNDTAPAASSPPMPVSNRDSTTNLCGQGHPQQHRSLSDSSFASVKESLQRVIGCTPPPPYEAVARDIDKEEAAMAAGIDRSKLTFTPNAGASSDPSTSSSIGTPSQSSEIIEIFRESGSQSASRRSSGRSSNRSQRRASRKTPENAIELAPPADANRAKETSVVLCTVDETKAIISTPPSEVIA